MTRRLCAHPGCARIAEARGRCRAHAADSRRQTRSPFNSFYASKAWAMSRRQQLFQEPFCEECGQLATVVHHRVDLRDGGAPRDPQNLASLCAPCHNQTTRRRQVDGGRV